jgi:acyl-CoA thioester hydrolase
VIGLAVETHSQFHRPLAFPMLIDAGLRVGKLGNSSVRYEVGLFARGEAALAAGGYFVHVFVDRDSRRPAPLPQPLRAALARLVAVPSVPSVR